MKRYLTTIVSIMLCLFFWAPYVHAASLRSLRGTVHITTLDGSSIPATTGMTLTNGYHIHTEMNSYCDVALDDQNTFRIKEDTHIQIAKLDEASEKPEGGVVRKTQIDLFNGSIAATLDALPKNGEFDITTPVSIAGATGTAFHVAYHESDSHSRVSVYENKVLTTSRGEPEKIITVSQMRSVDVAPWEEAILTAQGRGILSEAILGRQFTQEAETTTEIEAKGLGRTAEEAIINAQEALTILILNLRTDVEHTVDQILIENPDLTEQLFSAIARAKVLGILQNADQTFSATIRINGKQINDILKRPLFGIPQTIIPLTMMEYAQKFGAKARVTTERAAKVEGYRNLAELIYGTVISSETTVENFAVKDDSIRTLVQGVVRGARIVKQQYYSDGSIMVWLEIDGRLIPEQLNPQTGDIFGANYVSSPQIIQYRDFNAFLTHE